ncbi:hypothetical protein [Spirosoma spitsbergense]|uniref:hypothetical protein n=1 Tax=Spirosoma spitsbergense TaxID=431554 RepID=UPI0012F8D5D9|nr:hypothetical protein [Spirosoma spitsbergense]
MNTTRCRLGVASLFVCLMTTSVFAQFTTPTIPSVPEKTTVAGAATDSASSTSAMTTADTTNSHLDQAVSALDKGDKVASAQELKTGIAALETQATQQPTSFKDKLLAQAGKLKALLPLIMGGGMSSGVLGKAVGLAKLASGGNKIAGLMSAGSLIGKGSQLTSSLSGLSGAMSVLGGGASTGQSLISTAMSSVGKLDQGGMVAKAAEPAVKNQLGSVLNFVKGAL